MAANRAHSTCWFSPAGPFRKPTKRVELEAFPVNVWFVRFLVPPNGQSVKSEVSTIRLFCMSYAWISVRHWLVPVRCRVHSKRYHSPLRNSCTRVCQLLPVANGPFVLVGRTSMRHVPCV